MARFRILFGVAITVIWVLISAVYLRDSWPTTARFEADAIKQWAVRHGESLILFWLVLGYFWIVIGYFHNAALIRRNTVQIEESLKTASAALQVVETESHKQRHYQLTRVRAAQPRWEVSGCMAHGDQLEVNLRNTGAPAADLSIWKKDLPLVSNTTFVDRGDGWTIKVVFTSAPIENFVLTLEYCDAAGAQRTAQIQASTVGAIIQQEEI
ncbi:MAG: hypothetical protein V4637_17530 [Pseudomonadota bacterium]